jgi:hypothetical protein
MRRLAIVVSARMHIASRLALASLTTGWLASCGPYVPPPSFASQSVTVQTVEGQPTPVTWSFAYDRDAGTMTIYFTNPSDQPVSFSYRVSQRAEDMCTGGPFDFQAVGDAQISPGQTVQQVISSAAVDRLHACVWNYQGAGVAAALPAEQLGGQAVAPLDRDPPAAPPTRQSDLCYQHSCNTANTGKKCFANKPDYCRSLCAEANCAAEIACQQECR